MENKLLSSPANSPAEVIVELEHANSAASKVLADVTQAIAVDTRINPEEYLEETRSASSGE
jgi:hypothetical protein